VPEAIRARAARQVRVSALFNVRTTDCLEAVGQLDQLDLGQLCGRGQAIYFPIGLESFGYPLDDARVSGQPTITRDTSQNLAMAGRALYGFTPRDPESLRRAVTGALSVNVAPEPEPFDPDRHLAGYQ
jgi:hypothetical protein